MIDNQRTIFDLVNNILYIFTFGGKRKKKLSILVHMSIYFYYFYYHTECVLIAIYIVYTYIVCYVIRKSRSVIKSND